MCIIGEATTLSSTTLVEVSLLILVVVIFVAPSSVGKTLESRQRSSDACVSRLPCGVKNSPLLVLVLVCDRLRTNTLVCTNFEVLQYLHYHIVHTFCVPPM